MRLYLSSFRNGNKPNELLKLIGDNLRTAVIFNAVDFKSDTDRAIDYATETERLKSIGLDPIEIDLRQYFDKPADLKKTLSEYGLVWVRGGNSFVLRRAFMQSGADTVIKELLEQDVLAYGGYSAGIAVLQPHLRGVELVDERNVIPDGYSSKVIWDGLGLLPYCVAPHYKSDHPESADIDKLVSYYTENHVPFIALRDGEAIVVNGENYSVAG